MRQCERMCVQSLLKHHIKLDSSHHLQKTGCVGSQRFHCEQHGGWLHVALIHETCEHLFIGSKVIDD